MFKHAPMEIAELKRILEAAILAANTPQTLVQLNDLFGDDNPPGVDSIHAAIELLQSDYADRGVALVEVASGWRFQVRPEMQVWVSRLWTERQPKYTRALLETLALIAYRQPVTRAEIEQIRGVAVSSNIIRTLEEREWIRVLGHRDVPGKPALFGTTRQFLDYFGLKSLDQLPPLAELRDLSELEPQLDLDRIAPVAVAGRLAADSDAENDADAEAEADTDTDADADADDGQDEAAAGDSELESLPIESDDEELGDEFDSDEPYEEESTLPSHADDVTLDSVETVIDADQPAHESIEANVEDGAPAPDSAKDTP
jgi:segregation and condensation protein B